MLNLFKNKTLQAVILFLTAFGGVMLFVKLVTIENYIACFLVFVVGIVISCILFKKTLRNIVSKTKGYEYMVLIFSLFLHLIICYYCLNFLSSPIIPFERTGISFLLLNKFFIGVMPLNVLFQQIILTILITKLYQYKMSFKNIILMFVIIFGAAHIFQIFSINLFVGLGFTFFAIVGSFIFPYMILKVRNGYLYNIMIHLLVYDIATLVFWTLY